MSCLKSYTKKQNFKKYILETKKYHFKPLNTNHTLIHKVDMLFDHHPVHLLLCLVFRVKNRLTIRHSVCQYENDKIMWSNIFGQNYNVEQYLWSEQ